MANLIATSEYKTALKAFSRALGREAHVLTREPGVFWQQMYNRLQWEEDVKEALGPDFIRRSASSARLWLRVKTPFRESQALVCTLEGHLGGVTNCMFSPDGRLIVSSSSDNTIKIWNPLTGELVHTMVGHTDHVNASSFSPDARYVVSCSDDMTLRIWATATGQLLRVMEGHASRVVACTFSPDGRWIISAEWDKKTCLWDSGTGRLVRVLEGGTPIGFSPDGCFVLSNTKNETMQMWTTDSNQPLRTMKAGICCAFSPDGRLIATGHDQRTMIWETDTGALLHTLEGNTTLVAGCAFSPDGRTIITAGYDKALRMFDTANGQLLCTLVGHTLELTACAFSPDGQFLLSASYDNTLRLWNAAVNEISLSGENRDSCINSVAFSPNGGMIASTNVDGVRVCDSTSGATLHTLKRHATWDSASACSFSPDGRYIVSSHEKTLLIWDSTNGELLRTLKTNTEFPPVFAFSPEGHLLVPGTLDDAWGVSAEDGLWVLEFANRSPLFRLERPTAELWDCSYSPDGKWILTVHKDSTQRLWDAFTGKLIYTLGHTSIKCAFSPDGHSILLSTYWDTLLLGTVSGESLFTMEGGDPIISPDGNFITTNLGTTFQVWEESSGQRLRELEGHTYRPIACFYSPDGKFLLSASGDRTLRVWDPNTGKQVDCLVLPGRIKCMGLHPTAPQIVCGDEGGAVYRVEIIGLEYGAIIVTASEVKLRLEVRCPACQNKHPISQTQLGTELICPNAGCGLHLKINPFVIHMA